MDSNPLTLCQNKSLVVALLRGYLILQNFHMMSATNSALTLDISIEQLLRALFQLPAAEKIRIANQLRAEVAAEKFRLLSNILPEVPEIGMEEIVREIKDVRKSRKIQKHNS